MQRFVVLALVAGALAFAEEQPASTSSPEAVPNRQKYLDDALRDLILRSQTKPPTASPAEARCAYIRIIPADPAIDRRMILPNSGAKVQEQSRRGMPVYPGLPACDSNVTR